MSRDTRRAEPAARVMSLSKDCLYVRGDRVWMWHGGGAAGVPGPKSLRHQTVVGQFASCSGEFTSPTGGVKPRLHQTNPLLALPVRFFGGPEWILSFAARVAAH